MRFASPRTSLLLALGMAVLAIAILLPRTLQAKPDASSAPGFNLEVLQGAASGALEDHRGKVVIVEFWATYCGWCKATHPKLASFASKHGDNAVVLGISAQRKSRLKRYLRKHKTGITILHDPKARISRSYRASATPTLVVIDAEGKMRGWAQGGNKLKSILQRAESLLATTANNEATE